MVKVYYGPYKHSPAPELPLGERVLWLSEFHLLRGFDRDFWTNNPMMLDSFEAEQIQVWTPGGWQSLALMAAEFLPGWFDSERLKSMTNGMLAITVEMAYAHLEKLADLELAQGKAERGE